MRRGLSLFISMTIMLASYGCIVEHREDEYQRHEHNRRHREYRGHEEYRNDGFEKEDHDGKDYDEHKDQGDRDQSGLFVNLPGDRGSSLLHSNSV